MTEYLRIGFVWNGEMQRLYIKSQQCNAVNKRWSLGTATQDKCEMTHASPGPISSLIEMEHKFSVSRTKILLSWDDSWLMVQHHFLHCPWPDWQVEPRSLVRTRVNCRDYMPLHSQRILKRFKIKTWDLKKNELKAWRKQLVPLISRELEISALQLM